MAKSRPSPAEETRLDKVFWVARRMKNETHQQRQNGGVTTAQTPVMGGSDKQVYLECLLLIERLHRRFLDVIKLELDRLGIKDVNNVQTLILYNIGEAEMTVGELTSRGYYLGSNVSYNLKKLVENSYLEQERSPYDRRSVRVRLSPKGLELYGSIDALHDEHVAAVRPAEITGANWPP